MTHWDWLEFRLRVEDLLLRFFLELGRIHRERRGFGSKDIVQGMSQPFGILTDHMFRADYGHFSNI